MLYLRKGYILGSLAFAAAVSCQAEAPWVRDTSQDTNVVTITSAQHGRSEYSYWDQSASGTASVSFGARSVTVSASGSAQSDAGCTEGPGGGDAGTATLSAHGGGTWRWTGTPGASPNTTVTISANLSGSITDTSSETMTGDGFYTGEADAYSIGTAGCAPNSNSTNAWAQALYTETDPTLNTSGNTTLSDKVTYYDVYTISGGSQVSAQASANYTITINTTYQTKAGQDYITAYASIDCYAYATYYAISGYPTTGRVFGESAASSSCTGSASASF